MKLKVLCSYLDYVVPLSFQEDYDNSGLQIGLSDQEISSALVTLDVTDEVIDEAVSKGCNLIVSHHPLIFRGIKRISDKTYAERIIYKAIKNEIAIYSAHTNLDIFRDGVSRKMADKLDLKDIKVLSPLKGRLMKLVTFVPESYLEKVRSSVFEAGAGVTGKYDQCGFITSGIGSFRGGDNTKPFVGKKGSVHYEKEIRFETVFYSHLKETIVNNLITAHPYEEVAYDLFQLENVNKEIGLGCIGEFKSSLDDEDFLKLVSEVFDAKGLRYSKSTGKKIKKVSVCGGSGISLLNQAIASGVDAFITSDIKYHNFFDADNKIMVVDIGHFESEKFSTEILYDLIVKKFPKFAVRFSGINTNPINYF
jgi:dinuclear metal center YbgI/SA1388 family protein